MADNIPNTIRLIGKQVKKLKVPWVTVESKTKDPYRVLISCILSLRTQDKTTGQASQRLFRVADKPKKMVKLSVTRLARLIYPVGFYRNKAKYIQEINRKIIKDFGKRVPGNLEDLLSLKGVGRKTANLVLGLGYNIPAICVDTHVHRISNRLGWVDTGNPHQTEERLKSIIPKRYWIRLNTILVAFGQNICLPIFPYCSRCWARSLCQRRNVSRWR